MTQHTSVPMAEIHEILTELVNTIVSIECTTPGCLHIPRNDCIETAIKTATEQIKAKLHQDKADLLEALVKLQGIMSLNDPTSFIRDNQAHCNGVAKKVSAAISKAKQSA